MAETKHTPGPWTAEVRITGKNRNGRQWVVCAGPEAKRYSPVAQVYQAWPSSKTEADARLLAAAPELLEALRPLAAWAALRPDGAEDAEVILHAAGCWPVTWGDASRAAAAIAKAEGR